LNKLLGFLTGLDATAEKAHAAAVKAGLDVDEIEWTRPARDVWEQILEQAGRSGLVPGLTRALEEDFPEIAFLLPGRAWGPDLAATVPIQLKPLGDRVVIRRYEVEEKTAGGILLPDTAKQKPQCGKVLAVGDGRLLKGGLRQPLQCKVGDQVVFKAWAGEHLSGADDKLVILNEEDILAKLVVEETDFEFIEEPAPKNQPPRYVNVCLTRPPDHEVLPATLSLAPSRDYHLRIDVGALSPQSVVRNAERLPAELLPPTEDGHWLEVFASSKDFSIPQRRHHLFLPQEGPGWVCGCRPGNAHTCRPAERGSHLFIGLKTPPEPGLARVRLGVYCEKNLVQSQLLTAEIAEAEQQGQGHSSWIDYTLAARLTDLSFLPPRAINILTNESADGSHLVLINGPDCDLELHLTEGQMRETVEPAREALRRIHFKEYGGQAGTVKQRENLYDAKNSKSTEAFIEDLRALAVFGQQLWLLLLEDEPAWWARLREPLAIQVARVVGSRFVFPWALLYDIPLERGATEPYARCELLKNWDREKQQLVRQSARRCPYESNHPSANVLCPFGFWGLKHRIEQPPSAPKNGKASLEIKPANHPPELVVGLSRTLDRQVTDSHLEAIGRLPDIRVRLCDSRETVKQAFSKCVELIYFSCHGRRKPVAGSDKPTPYLEVGQSEEIHPEDISTWRRQWPREDLWKDASPLVFINGCHTAELTPESLLTFVDTFAKAHAAGVIGTEITLDQGVASEAGEEFFTHLRNSKAVGEALHLMRLHLLAKNNVLGMAYTPYCSASLALAGAAG